MSAARQSADYWHWFSRPIPFSSPEPVVSWSRRVRLARVQFSSLASRWKTREKIAPVMRATYTRFENKQSKRLFSFFLNLGWGAGECPFSGGEREEGRENNLPFFLRSPFRLPGLQAAHASSQPFVSWDGLGCLQRRLPASLLPSASPRLECGFVANHKGNEKHTRKTACYAGY